MSPQRLADLLQQTDRSALLACAVAARKLEKLDASREIADACQELTT
jgi:UDP-N-acetylglucosamine--N-acetylmuramyl-(pentapeptide) pyrophosphoryl-undecaprenol N-acetylglucosamine transferase